MAIDRGELPSGHYKVTTVQEAREVVTHLQGEGGQSKYGVERVEELFDKGNRYIEAVPSTSHIHIKRKLENVRPENRDTVLTLPDATRNDSSASISKGYFEVSNQKEVETAVDIFKKLGAHISASSIPLDDWWGAGCAYIAVEPSDSHIIGGSSALSMPTPKKLKLSDYNHLFEGKGETVKFNFKYEPPTCLKGSEPENGLDNTVNFMKELCKNMEGKMMPEMGRVAEELLDTYENKWGFEASHAAAAKRTNLLDLI